MKKNSRRKKNEERKRRFDAIKDLMSTFTMGTIAVVAAVTLIPASPKAEIIKSVALSEEIVYQVNVTDEDNALNLSTLHVVLENQFEYYEKPISLGENTGYFDSLEYETQYRLSVYGNKGFGQERLDTLMITTSEKVGGTILSVNPEEDMHSAIYNVDVSIYDPEFIYTSIDLYYGYRWEHDAEIEYSSIQVTDSRMNIQITDIFTSEPIHIYIEGTTMDGTELLDEIWVTPPYVFYTSLYLHYIDSKEVGFSVYNDLDAEDISYEMNIYNNNILIRTEKVILEESDFHSSNFVINGLTPNTTYEFECIATYTNPQTLRSEKDIVYHEEITTIGTYTYTYTKEIIDDYLEVTIVLNDPSHNFQEVYYEMYDTSEEFNMYIESETFYFIADGEEKYTTFTIFLPITSSYEITLTLMNQTDFNIKHKIDIILFEMGG